MKAQFAVCVDNSQYPASLEVDKMYRVIPDQEAEQDGDVRVIDESGEDYLFPANLFIPVEVPRDSEQRLMESFSQGASA